LKTLSCSRDKRLEYLITIGHKHAVITCIGYTISIGITVAGITAPVSINIILSGIGDSGTVVRHATHMGAVSGVTGTVRPAIKITIRTAVVTISCLAGGTTIS
jgi:hypothetical protein